MPAHPDRIDGYDWNISNDTALTYPGRDCADPPVTGADRNARTTWVPGRGRASSQCRLVIRDGCTSDARLPVTRNVCASFGIPSVMGYAWRDLTIPIPSPPPRPPAPIQYSVSVKANRRDPGRAGQLRFLSALGRNYTTMTMIAMKVPPPPDANPNPSEWTVLVAASRYNELERPHPFLETPAAERLPMIREAVHNLMRRRIERALDRCY